MKNKSERERGGVGERGVGRAREREREGGREREREREGERDRATCINAQCAYQYATAGNGDSRTGWRGGEV